MSELTGQFDPETSHDARQPEFEDSSPERAFFDPENLPPTEDIDLSPVRRPRNYAVGGDQDRALGIEDSVRYLSEAANGAMDDVMFKDYYEKAVGAVLGDKLSNEQFSSLYDMLQAQNPRIIDLLQRVNKERLLTEHEFVTLTKLSIYVSVQRTIPSGGN